MRVYPRLRRRFVGRNTILAIARTHSQRLSATGHALGSPAPPQESGDVTSGGLAGDVAGLRRVGRGGGGNIFVRIWRWPARHAGRPARKYFKLVFHGRTGPPPPPSPGPTGASRARRPPSPTTDFHRTPPSPSLCPFGYSTRLCQGSESGSRDFYFTRFSRLPRLWRGPGHSRANNLTLTRIILIGWFEISLELDPNAPTMTISEPSAKFRQKTIGAHERVSEGSQLGCHKRSFWKRRRSWSKVCVVNHEGGQRGPRHVFRARRERLRNGRPAQHHIRKGRVPLTPHDRRRVFAKYGAAANARSHRYGNPPDAFAFWGRRLGGANGFRSGDASVPTRSQIAVRYKNYPSPSSPHETDGPPVLRRWFVFIL